MDQKTLLSAVTSWRKEVRMNRGVRHRCPLSPIIINIYIIRVIIARGSPCFHEGSELKKSTFIPEGFFIRIL